MTILKIILDTEDVDLLSQVGKILLPQKKVSGTNEGKKIVGSDPDGSPISQSELEKRIEESEKEIKRGEYIRNAK